MSSPNIVVEKEASPYTRSVAIAIGLAAQRPAGAALIDKLDTTFALKSCKGPQAVTVTIDAQDVTLSNGASPRADITIELDFDDPSVKPRVFGFWRHPLAAIKVGKLLSLPLPNWADSAKRFWAATSDLPHMPDRLVITCTDEDRSLEFGEGEQVFEILGKAHNLGALLIGQAILVDRVTAGTFKVRGSLEHLAGISNAGQKLILGELDG